MSTLEYNQASGSRLAHSPAPMKSADAHIPLIVLMVEDDELVRELGVQLLSEAGFRVLEAVNGDEALSLLEYNPNIRVLFTDINMPGSLDGFTLASVAAVQWPHLAIIIGSGEMLPRSGSLPRGITFVRKPYDPESIIRLIRKMTKAPA